MPAPKGNQFWKIRTKHGRDVIFDTPQLMLEAAYEYFEWCDKHPWVKHEALKSGERIGKTVKVPTSRPYTLSGLCLYIGTNSHYFEHFKMSLRGQHEDFSSVIKHIEEVIRTQKFEGASVGAFNANIIARDLGLVDKKDIVSDGESINKGFYEFVKEIRSKKVESNGGGDTA